MVGRSGAGEGPPKAQPVWTLLRANPSKDGDAELRGFGVTAMPAGPPANRPTVDAGGLFVLRHLAGESELCRSRSSCPSAWRVYEADRKSTRLNSSHSQISYAVFCLKRRH